MNNGQIEKFLYSPKFDTSRQIESAIASWHFGYAKSYSPAKKDDASAWLITIQDRGRDNNAVAVDACLHVGCGFSYDDNGKVELEQLIQSGDRLQEIKVTGKFKELAYLLHKKLCWLKRELHEQGREVTRMMITAVGHHISIEDYSLFALIARSSVAQSISNGCLFKDTEDFHLKLHIASAKKIDDGYFEVPPFLCSNQ